MNWKLIFSSELYERVRAYKASHRITIVTLVNLAVMDFLERRGF